MGPFGPFFDPFWAVGCGAKAPSGSRPRTVGVKWGVERSERSGTSGASEGHEGSTRKSIARLRPRNALARGLGKNVFLISSLKIPILNTPTLVKFDNVIKYCTPNHWGGSPLPPVARPGYSVFDSLTSLTIRF